MGKRYEGYKEGFKDGFREGLRARSENELREELKKELEDEVRQELRDELIDEVKEELREEVREECKEGYLRQYLDDFKKGFVEGFVEEYPKGIRKGKLEVLSQVVQDGVISVSEAAKFAGMTEDEFRKELGPPPKASSDATSDGAPHENASAADAPSETSTSDEMADGYDFDIRPIVARARMIGVEEGSVRILKQLVVDGVLTLAEAAESAWTSIPEFEIKAVRSEERWEMEYEALWDLVENKDELFRSHPEYEDTVEDVIAEWRESGVNEGARLVLDPLVDKGVLTEADARRYVDELC